MSLSTLPNEDSDLSSQKAKAVSWPNVLSTGGGLLGRYGMVAALAILVVIAQFLYPRFLAPANLSDLLVQNAALGIVAVGMTYVIISGGFDLSVGATYALGATVFAGVSLSHGVAVGALAALLAGMTVGVGNGVVISRWNVNPFVATLGTGSIISGLAYIYSKSSPFIVDAPSFSYLGRSELLGIPAPIVILVGTVLVGGAVLAITPYGRNIYAIGGNNEASRLSGLPVPALTASVYVMTGVLAALAGMVDASRLGVGQADVGSSVALDVIAIVVVGGTSLRGGEGAVWRSVVGLLIFATLTNVFYSMNVSQNWQLIAKGVIVVAAVALDAALRRRTK